MAALAATLALYRDPERARRRDPRPGDARRRPTPRQAARSALAAADGRRDRRGRRAASAAARCRCWSCTAPRSRCPATPEPLAARLRPERPAARSPASPTAACSSTRARCATTRWRRRGRGCRGTSEDSRRRSGVVAARWRRAPPASRRSCASSPATTGSGSAARRSRDARRSCGPAPPTADRVVKSVCPYCAVGCGQRVYVKDEQVVHIEGDPDSPISRGRLCPRGLVALSLVNSPQPRDEGALPRARTRPTGRSSTSTRRWT